MTGSKHRWVGVADHGKVEARRSLLQRKGAQGQEATAGWKSGAELLAAPSRSRVWEKRSAEVRRSDMHKPEPSGMKLG